MNIINIWRNIKMITYKAIYTCTNPKKTTVIFYNSKHDAENDAKIMLSTHKNILSVKISEVSKKL